MVRAGLPSGGGEQRADLENCAQGASRRNWMWGVRESEGKDDSWVVGLRGVGERKDPEAGPFLAAAGHLVMPSQKLA